MENAMPEEHRSHQRTKPEAVITIKNMVSGEPLGELVNITAEGLMLLTDEFIENGSIYQMVLYGTTFEGKQVEFNVGAECVWSRNAGTQDRFWSGYHIIDASQQAKEIIASLIEEYAVS